MSTTTTNRAFSKAVDADNARTYLRTTLAASLDSLDTILGATPTLGSVIVAGTSGNYTQDNANFFWDDTNNRLGIGTASPSSVLHVTGSVSPAANANAAGAAFASTLVEAGSGTHARLMGVSITAPSITGAAATVTATASLYISGAPTGGTNNYALWVDAGAVQLDSTLTVGDTLTVSAGGITVTGNSTITGTLGGVTTLTATTLAGTLSTAAQANITSVGTLTSLATSGAITVTSASASALIVGANGATDPVLKIDASAAGVVTGVSITAAGPGSGARIAAMSSGANEDLRLDAKGTGAVTIAGTSTGGITLTRVTTVTAGGLTVTAGNIGVGGAAGSNIGITIWGSTLSGVAQYGIRSNSTISSAATTSARAGSFTLTTPNSVFTTSNMYVVSIEAVTKGASHTITSLYGLYVEAMTVGGTNNYGIYVDTPSGGSGSNIGVYVAGAGVTVAGGGITVTGNSTITGTLGSLTGLTVASGGATITAGGLRVTAGNVGVGVAAATWAGLYLNGSIFTGHDGSNSQSVIFSDATGTTDGNSQLSGVYSRVKTPDSAGTFATVAGIIAGGNQRGAASTVTDNYGLFALAQTITCTNAYGVRINAISGGSTKNIGLHVVTPTGTGAKTIDTDSGGGTSAYLTTTGTWTNASSWAAHKEQITPVGTSEIASLFDWMRDDYKPVRYRYPHRPGVHGGHQPSDYDSFGFLLDDMPENVRAIICSDPGGGISTKDADGFSFALHQEAARRIHTLETELTVLRAQLAELWPH